MSLVKQINKCLEPLGVSISRRRRYDPTDPFNVPKEWLQDGPKEKKPLRIVIGGGDRNYGPRWHNMEFVTAAYAKKYKTLPANIDIPHDLTAAQSFPIADESIEAVYTSHVIEHLQDEHVAQMFKETFRVMKRGGIFRITCPDIDLYVRAFIENDLSFFHYRDHPHYKETGISSSVAGMFLDVFATPIANSASYEEIARYFQEMGVPETLDHYKSKVAYDAAQSHFHINYFNVAKLKTMLNEAGFADVRVSAVGQSYYPDMRNLAKFDTQDFKISLFVECVK